MRMGGLVFFVKEYLWKRALREIRLIGNTAKSGHVLQEILKSACRSSPLHAQGSQDPF